MTAAPLRKVRAQHVITAPTARKTTRSSLAAPSYEAAPNLQPPVGNPRFPLFDALRAVAALTVFTGHVVLLTHPFAQSPRLYYRALTAGQLGVAIFFLISGFLLYRPFLVARRLGHPSSIRDFLRRRVLRIVPAYWVALSLLLLAGLISGVTSHNWWLFYGFAQDYNSTAALQGINVAWTLGAEVGFYLALPIFAMVASRLARGRNHGLRADALLLATLTAASLVYRLNFSSSPSDYYKTISLPGMFLWFALGMGLALASVALEARPERSKLLASIAAHPSLLWAAAAVIAVLSHHFAVDSRSNWHSVLAFALRGLAALFVLVPGVFGDTAGGLPRRILRLRSLAWVGLVSYAFYLYHFTVVREVAKFAATEHWSHPFYGVFAVSLGGSCAIAAASYYLLERPIMRRGRRRSGVPSQPPA
ncbi:MAG: acyltransferase family protein [Solirubrobacteraceae bacterium]